MTHSFKPFGYMDASAETYIQTGGPWSTLGSSLGPIMAAFKGPANQDFVVRGTSLVRGSARLIVQAVTGAYVWYLLDRVIGPSVPSSSVLPGKTTVPSAAVDSWVMFPYRLITGLVS